MGLHFAAFERIIEFMKKPARHGEFCISRDVAYHGLTHEGCVSFRGADEAKVNGNVERDRAIEE